MWVKPGWRKWCVLCVDINPGYTIANAGDVAPYFDDMDAKQAANAAWAAAAKAAEVAKAASAAPADDGKVKTEVKTEFCQRWNNAQVYYTQGSSADKAKGHTSSARLLRATIRPSAGPR